MFACFPAATGENGEITIAWDPSFMKTVPGRLKLGAIITNFIVFICVIVSELSYTSSAKWANFVAWMGLLITAQFLLFHLLRITQVYSSIPWWKIEMGFAILWGFFYLTVSIDLAIKAKLHIPSTLNIDFIFYLAYTMDYDCSEILNHGLNHGLFLSLFKLFGWKYILLKLN